MHIATGLPGGADHFRRNFLLPSLRRTRPQPNGLEDDRPAAGLAASVLGWNVIEKGIAGANVPVRALVFSLCQGHSRGRAGRIFFYWRPMELGSGACKAGMEGVRCGGEGEIFGSGWGVVSRNT